MNEKSTLAKEYCGNDNSMEENALLKVSESETEWETCGLWTEFAHGNTTRKRVKKKEFKMIKIRGRLTEAGRDSRTTAT